MAKEILLRAKRRDGKTWWSDFSISNDGETVWHDGDQFEVEEDDIIVNSATGRIDVNGEDIFEDDLLKGNFQVIWNQEKACWVKEHENGNQHMLDDTDEIVGNVYDESEKEKG